MFDRMSLNTYILLRAFAAWTIAIVLAIFGWIGFIFIGIWFFRILGWVFAAYDPII